MSEEVLIPGAVGDLDAVEDLVLEDVVPVLDQNVGFISRGWK